MKKIIRLSLVQVQDLARELEERAARLRPRELPGNKQLDKPEFREIIRQISQ